MFQVPLAGQSINSANIGIESNISSSTATIGNASITNATIGQLTTTIFSPQSVTTNTLEAGSATLDTLVVNNVMEFLNVIEINASRKNVCNISCLNLSASQITCDNLQPLLTAGTNISILNGVISAANDALLPSNANFSSVTSDVVNVLFIDATNMSVEHLSIDQTLSVAGNVNISGILTASNLSTGSLKFGDGLLYDPFDSALEVDLTGVVTEGDDRPVTSWGVYKALDTRFSNIQTVWAYTLSEAEFISVATSVPAGGENTICYLDIYPNYENSKIVVEFSFSYTVAGNGTDTIVTEIRVGTNNNVTQTVIQELFQQWNNAAGGGTRSGTGGNIKGVYTNNDSIGKFHRIQLRIDNNSDDVWSLDNAAFVSIQVTEFVEIEGVSNPNIRIGSGNISCGNISCNALTSANFTVDNLITTFNVNVGGDAITVGFPQSGSIAAKSTLRLAGGSTVLNSGDLTWDGTTFNLSARQANKNFKVSFGQQDYFEVNSTNTSCRDLKVNGFLQVSGALNLSNLILDNSLLINGFLTGDDASFRTTSFTENVSFFKRINCSNVSILGNVSVQCSLMTISGNLSMRGNICARNIFGENLSTAYLSAGQNISIHNGSISAFLSAASDLDIRTLHVDEDVDIIGSLNVSTTSTFSDSLNVCNILYAGKSGQHDGSVVIYSQTVGNNWATKFDGTIVNMSATGTASQVNTWIGSNKTLSITPTGVNICGTLKADAIDADYENFSTVNLSVQDLTVSNQTTLNNVSIINLTVNETDSSIVTATQINGINGQFSGSLTAPNISTGSLVFGSGLTFFLGTLSVDFTTSETQVQNLENSLAIQVDTDTLNAGLATIDALSVSSFIQTPEINVSQVNCSDIDSNSGTIDVLDCTNLSTVFFSSDNISCNALDVNTSINTRHINCSTLSLTDTGGGLNVCGTAYLDALFVYGGTQFETDDVYFGKPEATGTNSRINFWSLANEVAVGARFGLNAGNILRLDVPSSGGVTTYNILMGNVSTMTMTNTSTRFHQALNVCGRLTVNNASFNNVSTTDLTVTNITSPSLTTANMSIGAGLNLSNNVLTGTTSLTASGNIQIVSDVISTIPNINVSTIAVNTSITASFINTSSTKTNQLNVCGLTSLDSLTVAGVGASAFLVDEITVGKSSGTGSRSVVTFWSPFAANNVALRIGIDDDSVARISIPDYGQFPQLNVTIGNVSYLTMGNNSTRFQRNVIFQNDVTGPKFICTNVSNTNMSITNGTINTLRGTTLNGITINASNLNISTKLTTTNISATNFSTTNGTITTLRGTTLNGTTINASNLNISTNLTTTNISATNITATSIVAPNVQPTLTAGDNISIVGNTISATGGGTTLTAGNNISILNDVISTTANLNSSNLSVINGSFTNLTCSGNISFPIGNLLYRDPFSSVLNVSEGSVSTALIGPLRTTFNTSLIQAKKLNVSNISLVAGIGGGVIDMGGLGQITKLGILTGMTLNSSQTNSSNISCINITATSVTAPNVQQTLTAGSGITIVGTTISSTGGGTALTAGNNISILNDVVSTTATINVSVVNCSDIDANTGTIDVFDSGFATLTNLSSTNFSGVNITATSITAPNVQQTLTAGTGITLAGATISTFDMPYFSVKRSADLAVSSTSNNTKMSWNVKEVDNYNAYNNTTTFEYTFPVSGVYWLGFSISMSNAGTTKKLRAQLQKSGTIVALIFSATLNLGDNFFMYSATVKQCNAGQTLATFIPNNFVAKGTTTTGMFAFMIRPT